MFSYIDNFYEPNDLGLVIINFLNINFRPSHQSQLNWYGGDRMKAYPCYESNVLEKQEHPMCPYTIFKNTFEKKTKLKLINFKTYFRKTKKIELENSKSWRQCKPHKDEKEYNIAGLIYFNSNSLKDGTYFYTSEHDYEPTAKIGSLYNRCVFYNSQIPHCPSMEQTVEERWIQPFFLKTEEHNET